jgi:hypothetical protein
MLQTAQILRSAELYDLEAIHRARIAATGALDP